MLFDMYVSLGAGRVFVVQRGQPDAPAVLFLHGGPGQGCVDFVGAQADRLAASLRVVALDQRGTLRSDPLPTPALSVDDLVRDCDLLRQRLGIECWVVLAHSLGALVGVRYAAADAEHVVGLILDCPCLDVGDTCRGLLSRAEAVLRDGGSDALADAARRASSLEDSRQLWQAMKAVWRELGDFYEPVYFYDGQSASVMDDIRHRAHVGDELDDRVAAHTAALEADPAFYLPVTDLLVGLSQPMLVIRGASDPVCTDAQLAVMRTHVGADRVVTLDQSGHFPYVEQPARYASLVTEFVQDR